MSVAIFVLLGTLVFAQQPGSGTGSGAGQAGRQGQGRPGGSAPFAVAETSIGKIYTTVGGRLEPESRIIHKTTQTGLVTEIYVALGERVSEGQPLFSIRQNLPGNRYLPVVVEARISGTVSELLIDDFEEVNAGIPAVVVVDRERLRLEAVAGDKDAFSIRRGIPVSGRNPEGETFPGSLNSISIEPDYQTGLFTLSFSFSGASGARVGMPLLIDLPVKQVSGIFVGPEAVVRRYGRNSLWIVNSDNTIESRIVETGQVVENRVLIRNGLAEGERYLRRPTGNERNGMALTELVSK